MLRLYHAVLSGVAGRITVTAIQQLIGKAKKGGGWCQSAIVVIIRSGGGKHEGKQQRSRQSLST